MLNLLYCYTGSTFRYGYSARSFALSDAMLADDYQVFQSLSNPASLNKSSGTNYGVSFFQTFTKGYQFIVLQNNFDVYLWQ